MAQLEDLVRRLQRRPFAPFRLCLTDGAFFDIRHPEMVLLSRRSVEVGLREKQDQPFADSVVTVDLFHVIRCEPLDQAAAPAPEGN